MGSWLAAHLSNFQSIEDFFSANRVPAHKCVGSSPVWPIVQQQQQIRGKSSQVAYDEPDDDGARAEVDEVQPYQQQHMVPYTDVIFSEQLIAPGEQVRAKAATYKVPIYACHLCSEIDYQSFCTEHRFKSRAWGRDNVLLEIEGELHEESVLMGADRDEQPEKIMVIYRYGSVIFFNMRAKEQTLVVVRPDLGKWSALEPDKIVVREMSVGNVRVISHVLGQSVALDYYNSKVDEAIQLFTPYLRDVATTGRCVNIKETRLLQLIADNSLLYTDVVTKIGLLDISQTAWGQDRYHELWNSLRVDYEIDRRFDAINRKVWLPSLSTGDKAATQCPLQALTRSAESPYAKVIISTLGPMLENAKFLLDIRAEKKSVEAEWIIIGLICLEVAVNFYGHFFL
eukprot:gene7413-7622_t